MLLSKLIGSRAGEFSSKFFRIRLNENRAVREDNGWDASIAVVDLHDKFDGFRVAFEPHAQVMDVVCLEEFPCPCAIRAIFGGVHYDLRWRECVEVCHVAGNT
jgi:hypothetical protein